MATRITDQFIEVLFTGEGTIRATRAYVECLRSLAQAAGAIHEREVEDDLDLVSTPFLNWEKTVTFGHSLAFDDDTEGYTAENVIDVLAFEQFPESFLYIGNVNVVIDDLGLSDSVEGDNADVQEVFDELAFTGTLSFIGPRYVSLSSGMGLNHDVSAYLGVPWLPIEVEHELGITDRISRVQEFTINDVLTFVQSNFRIFKAESTLSFTQSMQYGKGPADDPEHDLGLDDDLELIAIFVRSVEHEDFLFDAVTFYVDTPCARKTYNVYSGEGPGAAIPDKPLLSTPSQFTLESIIGPKQTVVLRNPETDDRDRLGFNRINRETRGGELNVYSDPIWPKVNTLLFTFTALKKTQLDDLQDFMLSTLGQEIKVHDWSGRVWKGVIITPEETAVEDAENAWTISFEFEGEPYDGVGVDDWLELDDTAVVSIDIMASFSDLLGIDGELGHSIES